MSEGSFGNRGTASITTLGLVLTLFSVSASGQTRWHVDASAASGADGLSWGGAFQSVNEALSSAVIGDEIWVKAGIYTSGDPLDISDSRTATFYISPGISLYGGFNGTETSFDQRAELFEQTILTGDLGVPGDPSDNAYHVVKVDFPSGVPPATTTVDGFTIRDGNANTPAHSQGGGVKMFNSVLWLSNCIIRDNRAQFGAGLHGQPAGVRVRWCEFINNHATDNGGAIWGQSIDYKISHTIFRRNTADKGGAIYQHSTSEDVSGSLPVVLIHNCLLHDNGARLGGAIYLGGGNWTSGKATFSNCTVAYNRALVAGGGAFAATGTEHPALSHFDNCIVWNNSAPLHPNLRGRHGAVACNIQDGIYYGPFNISVDPQFVDGPNRDLHLSPGSPSADVGVNSIVPPDAADVNFNGNLIEVQTLDLDRNRRFQDEPTVPDIEKIVDMGVYEL